MSNVIPFPPVVNRQEHVDTWQFSNSVVVPVPETGEQYLECIRLAVNEKSFLEVCGGILSRPYYEKLDDTSKSLVQSYFEFRKDK